MRYTYLFTQISREENGNLVPVTDKPNEFIFTFGKKIETFLKSPDNTVLLKKDMWKENPATNKEILPCVCFSTPSKQGYRRPLVMSKVADNKAGEYKCEQVYKTEIEEGDYLSEDIRLLTETFVNGVRSVNSNTMTIPWLNLKNVLETFFSLIPDAMIEKFDKGLEVHDKIREKLEGVPEGDDAAIEAVLKSQNYFKTIGDYNLFVVLRDYILSVKNFFNHLVWVMYRSKIGLVSLKKVKQQLSALFEFVIMVNDNCGPLEDKGIIKACSAYKKDKYVEEFLNKIFMVCEVPKKDKSYQAALCYLFQEECHHGYLNARYKCWDDIEEVIKIRHQEEFRDLCLRYWGINEPNSYKPSKCKKQKEEIRKLYEKVWEPMRKYRK